MTELLKNLSDAFAKTAEAASPAIVRVEARRRLPATGIVWSTGDGHSLIVTAHHVVEKETSIDIGLHDRTLVEAELVGRAPGNDLAVLRTTAELTPALWANHDDLRVGHLVLALGRPGETIQATVGVVSAIGNETTPKRRRRRRGGPWRWRLGQFIRTDVVMYPGFSGGPLVDASGQVRGVNTSGFRVASLTIPTETVRHTVDALVSHGRVRQGYLGVGTQPVRLPDSVTLDQETGLLIVSIEDDSPASQGGLLVGDIIVSLNGEAVTDVDELLALLTGDRVGQAVPVGLVRGGQATEVTVTIGERT